MFSVRLPQDLEDRLNRLARETGRTKTSFVREAITEHLAELEQILLAEKVLERVRAGEEGTVRLDEMINRYGVEGEAGEGFPTLHTPGG